MILKTYKKGSGRLGFWLLLVLCCLIFINHTSAAPLLVPGINVANLTQGNLSGRVYVSSDSSAITGAKVTFGNPSSVSFPDPKQVSPTIKISTGSLSSSSPISPLDYGADVIWYDGGYGTQNLANDQLYSGVIGATKSIGINVLRFPGGIPSDTYHWQDAVGPQTSRPSNVVYQAHNVFFPSTFGPDEFGQLLDKTGAVGDITVNFGTGTAQEAADWVQYMTASSKDNYWGELRAKNGHPAPYNVPYWEIGNETQASAGENYWRSGSVVSIGSQRGECHSSSVHLCQYVYGGVSAFSGQQALGANNNPVGNGAANQVFYAKFPPIVVGSQTVFVNGQFWREVSNLAYAAPQARVYQFDNTTGQIVFGDGLHGAVVPSGASVTISYQSGPHDGFIEFYKLMKAADPNAQICSSYESIDFIQLMGASNPYDCLSTHLYAGNIPSTNSSTLLFHNGLIQQSYGFASRLASEQAAIKQYAGARSKNINLAVTEYGVNALTYPSGQTNYHRSQDMALFIANTLKLIIDAHIPVAEKHYLISYQNSQPSGMQTYVNGTVFSNNALLGGPGPNPIMQPGALVLNAYSKLLYANLISSNVTNNPSVVFSGGSYPTLSVLATTDKSGHESIMVINLSASSTIEAEILPSFTSFKHVTAWTLGANNYLAYNTPSDSTVVGFSKTNASLHSGKLTANFPPSSITVLQLN